MPEDLARYRALFVHRDDVFSRQTTLSDGKVGYFPAGPHHRDSETGRTVYDSYDPLTDQDILDHLAGKVSLGVYTVRPEDQTVHYVVWDLDTYNKLALDFLCKEVERLVAQTEVDRVATDPAYRSVGRRCLLLEDSGGKGYHLWCFLTEPTSAEKAHEWGEQVRADYAANSYAEDPAQRWPALEVNPKQTEVSADRFGNLVKLPLGVHAKTHTRSLILHREGWAPSLVGVQPLDSSLLPEPEPKATTSAGRRIEDEASTLFPCINRILNEGVGHGCRNDAMYHLAHFQRGNGLTPDEVQTVCERANEAFDPPMTSKQIQDRVASAFRADSPRSGCNAAWLQDFCPGAELCYGPWNHLRAPKTGEPRHAPGSFPTLSLAERAEQLRKEREGN